VIVWTHVIGSALVHFVWQRAVLGILTAVVLRLLLRASPQTPYSVACTALAAMLVSPLFTRWSLARDPTPTTIARLEPVSFDAAETVSRFAVNPSGTHSAVPMPDAAHTP
jgi:hypothetical protein